MHRSLLISQLTSVITFSWQRLAYIAKYIMILELPVFLSEIHSDTPAPFYTFQRILLKIHRSTESCMHLPRIKVGKQTVIFAKKEFILLHI